MTKPELLDRLNDLLWALAANKMRPPGQRRVPANVTRDCETITEAARRIKECTCEVSADPSPR